MTDWVDGVMVCFDLESTGVNPFEDRIVSYCVGQVGGGESPNLFVQTVNPGVPIPPDATAIHGITDAIAAGGQPVGEAVAGIAATLILAMTNDIPVVGWNVAYDLTMLNAELLRHGFPSLAAQAHPAPLAPVIDGLVLDKHVDPYRKGSRRLEHVAAHYGVPIPTGTAHTPDVDALAAARIIWVIAKRYPTVRGMSLRRLHDTQEMWAGHQADSLRDYFERKGVAHDGCDPHWPIKMRVDEAAA